MMKPWVEVPEVALASTSPFEVVVFVVTPLVNNAPTPVVVVAATPPVMTPVIVPVHDAPVGQHAT